MKKLLLVLGVGLAAAGSWAFYPKVPAAAPSGGYFMVIGSDRPGTQSTALEIVVIQPDGTRQVQRLPDIKIGTERNSTAAVDMHRAELLKINALVCGWRMSPWGPLRRRCTCWSGRRWLWADGSVSIHA